jgi:CRP-like cAMP-binding protein
MRDPRLRAEDFAVPSQFQQDLVAIGLPLIRPTGAILISEGLKCNGAYIVTHGSLRMSHIADASTGGFELTLHPGSLFCLLPAMSKTRSGVTVESVAYSELVFIDSDDIWGLMKKRAGLCFEITKILSHEVYALQQGTFASAPKQRKPCFSHGLCSRPVAPIPESKLHDPAGRIDRL